MRRLVLRGLLVFSIVGLLTACHRFSAEAGEVRGSDLRSIIDNEIKDHVRLSYGEYAGENFSDDDLEKFRKDNVPQQIVDELRSSKVFQVALDKVRAMPTEERTAYMRKCRQPVHKTWAENGKISTDGQTDAGVTAEGEIAGTIVDLTESLLNNGPPANR